MVNLTNNSNSDDRDILKLEYGVLVDLIKHQHTRVQDFHRIFLTANTILIGACAILIKGDNPELRSYLFVLFCILGVAISMIWLCVLQRIKLDSDLRFFQLRNIERLLSRPNGVFSGGHSFFRNCNLVSSDGRESSLKYPTGLFGLLSKFRVVWAGIILPLLFSVLYLAMVTVMIFISRDC